MVRRKIQFCYRHTDEIARRRCYYCKRPICPRCQIRQDHHIFCGTKCHRTWKWNEWKVAFFSLIRQHLYRLVLYPLLLLLSTILLILVYQWNIREQEDISRFLNTPTISSRVWKLNLSAIRIASPLFGARIQAPRIIVRGSAPPNTELTLYVNGEVLTRKKSDARGRFEFYNVPLNEPSNVIQIEYRSGNATGFSPAILVFRYEENENDTSYVQRARDNILRGPIDRKEIALTFDGGESAEEVTYILRVLREYKVPATVFLTGQFIQNYPDETRQLAESPWVEVGNHTFSHPHLTTYAWNRKQHTLSKLTPEILKKELEQAANLFFRITGTSMKPLWRAPYGEHNPEIRAWASALGYTHVGWTIEARWSLDSLDWVTSPEDPHYRTGRAIVHHMIQLAQRKPYGINGGIVLMHLGSERPVSDRPTRYLPFFIKSLRERGYRFVFVSEMLKHLRYPSLFRMRSSQHSSNEQAMGR